MPNYKELYGAAARLDLRIICSGVWRSRPIDGAPSLRRRSTPTLTLDPFEGAKPTLDGNVVWCRILEGLIDDYHEEVAW